MRRVEVVKPPISYADLQRMPDDGNRYELYDDRVRPADRGLGRALRIVCHCRLRIDLAAVFAEGVAI
jgi:hypothetical protein